MQVLKKRIKMGLTTIKSQLAPEEEKMVIFLYIAHLDVLTCTNCSKINNFAKKLINELMGLVYQERNECMYSCVG